MEMRQRREDDGQDVGVGGSEPQGADRHDDIDGLRAMGPLYGSLHLLGTMCRLGYMLWGVSALLEDDHMYAPRLAPYMAVHLSTLVWRLVESAVRGKAVAKGEVAGKALTGWMGVLEQALPAAVMALCVAVSWTRSGFPSELTWRGDLATWSQEQIALDLCIAAGAGLLAAGARIAAPRVLKAAGVLQSSWPPDPVPGLEKRQRKEFADLEAKKLQQSSHEAQGGSPLLPACFVVARLLRLTCLALADELLYRSVIYYRTGYLHERASSDVAWTESVVHLRSAPHWGAAGLSALLSGCLLMSYRGEWAVGVAIGLVYQLIAVWSGSILPCVIAHSICSFAYDVYAKNQPVPKATGSRATA